MRPDGTMAEVLTDTTRLMIDEEEDDVFARPINFGRRKFAQKPPAKPIKIVLNSINSVSISPSNPDVAIVPASLEGNNPLEMSGCALEMNDIEELDDELEQEVQDSLSFFQDTHEDQDPAFAAFQRKLLDEGRQKKLSALDAYDLKIRKEIETVISDLCKEKQASTDNSLEKYKQRAIVDEKNNTQRYQDLYRQKSASNVRKINEGIEILQQRHQKDLSTAMGHHQQQVRQRRLTEQMAASEWHATSQQIQAKHNQQLTSFRNQGAEMKKKTEADYQRDLEKIRKQYSQKIQEVDSSRNKLHLKLYHQFQQLRQRYLKRHLQKIMKEKEELLTHGPVVVSTGAPIENVESVDVGESLASAMRSFHNPRELAKSTMEERAELNPPAPVISTEAWADSLDLCAGAATRHKHRKGVMTQTVRQLTVEIHNEGLWLAACPLDTDNDKKSDSVAQAPPPLDYEFLPWGVKAHQILDAVVMGEIPPGVCERIIDTHANAAELMAAQAGQVRCIVCDLRTSEETASSHRVAAVAEQEEGQLKELEQKVAENQMMAADAETACAKAIQDEKDNTAAVAITEEEVRKATRIQEEFKQKFKSFLGPGMLSATSSIIKVHAFV